MLITMKLMTIIKTLVVMVISMMMVMMQMVILTASDWPAAETADANS